MALHHQTAKKFARNLIRAIVAVAQHHIENDMAFVVAQSDTEESTVGMSNTLIKYRPGYTKTTSYNGSASLDNDDEVAELLRGLSPDETCAVADVIMGTEPMFHVEKYQSLNPGSRRMNAGNRIRGAIRRGDKTLADLEAAIKGDDLTGEEE